MKDIELILIGAGALVLLGGLSFGKLTEPITSVTAPVGQGAGKILGGIGDQGIIGWLIPDPLEDAFSSYWMGRFR